MRTTAAFIAALLCGCGLSMEKSLKPLVGQNIDVAVAKLSYPDRQRTTPGDTIYLWSTQTQRTAGMFTSTGGGMVGRAGVDPWMMNSYAGATVPYTAVCNIQIAVETSNTIKR